MSASSEKRKRTLYMTDTLLDVVGPLDERVRLTARLTIIADRYKEILDSTQIRRTFTDAEWDILRGALQGTIYEPAAMIYPLHEDVADYLMDTHDTAELEDVEGALGILGKLEKLSVAERIAVVEAVEQWWREKAKK